MFLKPDKHYSDAEEFAHAATHALGVLLSVAGLGWMLFLSLATGDSWRVAASIVYGTSLVALFLSSTIYHSLHASPKRDFLKLLDHCAIYLLIAGTYTPFLIVAMRGPTGWWLFGAIWSLAAIGILAKLQFGHRYPRTSLVGYLLMGWLIVVAGPEIAEAVGDKGMRWLIAGGLSYTVGAAFYAAKRLNYSHTIWHVFVLAGGFCHFMAVVLYVLPLADR